MSLKGGFDLYQELGLFRTREENRTQVECRWMNNGCDGNPYKLPSECFRFICVLENRLN